MTNAFCNCEKHFRSIRRFCSEHCSGLIKYRNAKIHSFEIYSSIVMKVFSCTTLLVLVSSLLPSLSMACRCMQPTLDIALNEPDSIVIVGKINDEIKLDTTNTTTDEIRNRYFTFKLRRVIKAPSCSMQVNDTIIVSTSASTASCGLNLQPNTWYTFSAHASSPQDGDLLLPLAVQVQVGACAYNAEGNLPQADRPTLRAFDRQQSHQRNCTAPAAPALPSPTSAPTSAPTSTSPLSSSCKTGADCADIGNEYCNAVTGTCHPIQDSCGTRPMFNCLQAPCTVTVACQDAQNPAGPLMCIDNYCGGCNAIFLDANYTQVCN
jgi:hypothetical protein